MLIDPRHLETLAAIVDAGGLTEGARALGKPQPSVSRTVAYLEARVGGQLFEKGRRPLIPTELGERLAAEGRMIAKATQSAQNIAQQFSTGHAGTIRVAGTPIFMDGVISNIIASFQTVNPELRVDQSYGYASKLIDDITSGTIDVGICPMEKKDVPDHMEFQTLIKGRNVIACGVTHPLTLKKSLNLEDISQFPWITQPAGSPLFQDLKDVLESIGVSDFKVSYSGGSLSSIVNVLTGSNALTVLPFSVVYMQPKNTIHALPIRIEHPKRELGVLNKSGGPLPIAAQRFVRHLTAKFDGFSRSIIERQRREIWRV